MTDNINPNHYKKNGVTLEPIVLCRELSFNLGNAFKYIIRYKDKNGIEDLKKACWYLRDILDHEVEKEISDYGCSLLALWMTYSDNDIIHKLERSRVETTIAYNLLDIIKVKIDELSQYNN